jgi:hypothetical protein
VTNPIRDQVVAPVTKQVDQVIQQVVAPVQKVVPALPPPPSTGSVLGR